MAVIFDASLLLLRFPFRDRFFLPRLIPFACVPTVLIYISAGISTCCPSHTPLRPLLRSRLPQGRSALPWNPWIFGLEDSHLHLATHSGILSSGHSAAPFGTVSAPPRMLPYRSAIHYDITHPQASVSCFSPGNFRRRTSRLVSYYALFECVAASEPTS